MDANNVLEMIVDGQDVREAAVANTTSSIVAYFPEKAQEGLISNFITLILTLIKNFPEDNENLDYCIFMVKGEKLIILPTNKGRYLILNLDPIINAESYAAKLSSLIRKIKVS